MDVTFVNRKEELAALNRVLAASDRPAMGAAAAVRTAPLFGVPPWPHLSAITLDLVALFEAVPSETGPSGGAGARSGQLRAASSC